MNDSTPEAAPRLRLKPRLQAEIAGATEASVAARPAAISSPAPATPATATTGIVPVASAPLPPVTADAPHRREQETAPPVSGLRLRPANAVAAPTEPPPAAGSVTAGAAQDPAAAPPGRPLAERSRRVTRAAAAITIAGVILFGVVILVAYPRLIAEHLEYRDVEGQLSRALAAAEQAERHAPAEPAAEASPTPAAEPSSSPEAAPASPAPAPAARSGTGSGDAFRSWIQGLKIAGVRAGPNPKLLIGSKTYNRGDVVQADLGITFEGYDAERRLVRFKTPDGTLLERRDR